MSLTFEMAKAEYQKDAIIELSKSHDGLRFLLMRSLSRNEHLVTLANHCNVDIAGVGARDLFKLLYESQITIDDIKAVAKSIYTNERTIRAVAEPALINELYKMQEFNWGGLHQNSLEKTIVDNYVKRIKIFEDLTQRIEQELFQSMKGYVRCSWYNHWTSIIIEDVFKEHKNVLPAVGLVKKIDFFVHDVPFDLKVTYLPEGFVKDYRRSMQLSPELTLLRRSARSKNLLIDTELNDSEQLVHLWRMISDHPDQTAKDLITELRDVRLKIVEEIAEDPTRLIVWLYENQGERRFDASNRLFLVLVNVEDFFQSWALKRNRALMSKEIGEYLDEVKEEAGREVKFQWEGKEYTTVADVVLIVHKPN